MLHFCFARLLVSEFIVQSGLGRHFSMTLLCETMLDLAELMQTVKTKSQVDIITKGRFVESLESRV